MKLACLSSVIFGFTAAVLAPTAHAQEGSEPVRGEFSRTLSGAGQRLGDSFRTVGRVTEEAVYVTGDAVEFGYRVHPGARVGRRLGLLPSGKLGLLPSHRVRPAARAGGSGHRSPRRCRPGARHDRNGCAELAAR